MEIKKLLTKVNFNKKENRNIEYIVIHYDGNKGATALNNAKYFESVNRDASAHYFVDENEIYQVVEDKDVAWHCGRDYSKGKAPYWNKCTNYNSIGIELCSDYNKDYYISRETSERAIKLVKMLMKKYKIPIDNVVRHFDVTYKECPAPFVKDFDLWVEFKNQLVADDEINIAINKLSSVGVISNPTFWKENYNTTEGLKYVKDLIIKFSTYLD